MLKHLKHLLRKKLLRQKRSAATRRTIRKSALAIIKIVRKLATKRKARRKLAALRKRLRKKLAALKRKLRRSHNLGYYKIENPRFRSGIFLFI